MLFDDEDLAAHRARQAAALEAMSPDERAQLERLREQQRDGTLDRTEPTPSAPAAPPDAPAPPAGAPVPELEQLGAAGGVLGAILAQLAAINARLEHVDARLEHVERAVDGLADETPSPATARPPVTADDPDPYALRHGLPALPPDGAPQSGRLPAHGRREAWDAQRRERASLG